MSCEDGGSKSTHSRVRKREGQRELKHHQEFICVAALGCVRAVANAMLPMCQQPVCPVDGSTGQRLEKVVTFTRDIVSSCFQT